MRIFRVLTTMALALFITACAGGKTAPPIPLDRSFSVSGFGMGDGSKVGILMKAVRSESGMVRICGAWQLKSNSPTAGRIAENFLYGAKLFLADIEVMRRLSFFEEYPPGTSMAGKPANCRDTQTPWQDSFRTATLHPVFQRKAFSR